MASLKLTGRKPREEFVFEVFCGLRYPCLETTGQVNTLHGHRGVVWNTIKRSSEFESHAKLLLAVVGVNVVFSEVWRIAT